MPEKLKGELSHMTGARQTMLAWSKIIESEAAVPEIYRIFFERKAADQPLFPYVVLVPTLDKFIRKTTEKMLCDRGDYLQILERIGSQVVEKNFPYESVHTVETGNILLTSWISLRGPTLEGEIDSATIEFNPATGDRILAIFLNKLRPAPEGADEASLLAEKEKFDQLSGLSFKFMNLGRSSLVPGAKVLQMVFQPEIRKPAWKLLGWTFYRTVTTTHLTVLTDKELIMIREDQRSLPNKGARYGGVWNYLPLHSLASVSLAETETDLITLTITISPEETFQKHFAASSRPELEQLRDQIQQLIGQSVN